MSKAKIPVHHVVYLIHDLGKYVESYRKLFHYFDYELVTDESYALGVKAPNGLSIWIMEAPKTARNDRDSNGLNHIAFAMDSQAAVDEFVKDFLEPNKITCLFDTPRARPDFTGEKYTYYQVMFEMPGGILIEVVHTDY